MVDATALPAGTAVRRVRGPEAHPPRPRGRPAWRRVLILGAGRFGKRAARLLRAASPEGEITVVDHTLTALEEIRSQDPRVRAVCTDGPAFLAAVLPQLWRWDYLLPCLPGQVAFQALRLGPLGPPGWETVPVPRELEALAPVAFRGAAGELYLSRAAHRCPEDCPVPPVCPLDGLPRRPGLAEVMAAWDLPGWEIRVLVSRLLLPGVGGIPTRKLRQLADSVAALGPRLILATACRCHGVAHAVVRTGGEGR